MNTTTCRWGILGTGHIAHKNWQSIHDAGNATLVAVASRDLQRSATFIAECMSGVPMPHMPEALGSYEALIARDDIDALYIPLPTLVRKEWVLKAAEAGKHVLVEKPLSESLKEAQELVALAEANNRVLQVGHIERFNPVMKQLEDRIQQPRFIEATRLSPFPNRSMDIGVVLDIMIHDLEIILHLVRSPILNVDAVGTPVLTRREDIANARIRFANGCVANVTASRISDKALV